MDAPVAGAMKVLLFHFEGVEAKIVAREADKEDRALASNLRRKKMLYRHR